MAITFPSSPTTNQVYSTANNTWVWDGTKWRVSRPINSSIQLGQGVVITAGNATSNDASFSNVSIDEVIKVESGGTGLLSSGPAGYFLVSDGKKWLSTATSNASLTLNGTLTLNGNSTSLSTVLKSAAEPITVSAIAATGTINFDLLSQSILYYTSNATANWTINIRGSSTAQLDSIMAVGQTVTLVHMVTQGSTAYYNNAVQIDGTTITPKWQYSTPSAGSASGIDIYTYTIIKTARANFTVLASQTSYK